LSLEAQRLLVSEQIGVVERGLVHELQCLRDEKHWQDDKVNLPSYSFHLFVTFISVGALLLRTRCKTHLFLWDLDVTSFDVFPIANSVLLFSCIEIVVLVALLHNVCELGAGLRLIGHVDVFFFLRFLMWEDRHHQTKIGTEVRTNKLGNEAANM
jgi:hypothetical protein